MTKSVDPSQYVVLDVETNGLKASEDDLLSISVYKPDDGRTFNRFLPLEKQSFINQSAFEKNGITESDLEGKKPLSQQEVNDLIRDFELEERTILCYGGGPGRSKQGFDDRFLRQYFSDHGLMGIDGMKFFNFKTMVHASPNRFMRAYIERLDGQATGQLVLAVSRRPAPKWRWL